MLLNNFYCNDKAKQTLVNFITDGRLPHTILLEGEDGCGKTTFAKMIAAAVLCQQERANRPCGACRNCRLILSDTHPDVEIVSSDNKANAFHIDQIREIRSTAYIRPNDGKYKVYILRNIHNMTEQAQNALLKIIEEPPAQVVFIMTCNNRARILQTILSRAAVIPISVCTSQECAKALETLADASVTAEQREEAAHLSQGNIGKALELLRDEKKLQLACSARHAAEIICAGQEFELLCCLQEYTGNKKREEFLQYLQEIRSYFWELIRFKNAVPGNYSDIPMQVKNRLTTLQAIQILDIIDKATWQVSQNVSLTLVAAAFCAAVKSISE